MEDQQQDGACHFCKNVVPHYEAFCFGCGSYVCESCEKNHALMGPHSVEEHLHELDEDGYDHSL